MTKAVSRFEANLLRVLRGLLQRVPAKQLLPMLLKPLPRPKCLSRDAVELIQDTLAKGCVQFLASHGWKRERFLRAGRITDGRLWERTPPDKLGLAFSEHALEFLIQLVSGTLKSGGPKVSELTIGDRLLLVFAFDGLRNTEPAEAMRMNWLAFNQDGLCRLAFLDELPEGTQRFRIDWPIWTTGLGASILEALQDWMAGRWTELERKKENINTVARMRKVGTTQARVFGEFLDALELAERRDLARCVLETARRLLHDLPTSQRWIRNLDVSRVRLADRLAIYHDALAFVRQLDRLKHWQAHAAAVSYFDDGYQASQLWKTDWERFHGEALCQQAQAIVSEVEPL